MSVPDPKLVSQVTNLMLVTRALQGVFFEHYREGEKYRGFLKTQSQDRVTSIKNGLAKLVRDAPRVKPALDKPNSMFNQFISTWNNGAGDLQNSFLRLDEFWKLLQAAESDLITRISQPPNRPAPTPRGTPADHTALKTLRTQTNQLYEVLSSYLKNNGPQTATKPIQEKVTFIGQQLNSSSLSPDAQAALASSKTQWTKFTGLYRSGNGLGIPGNWAPGRWECLQQLVEFQNVSGMACFKFLGN